MKKYGIIAVVVISLAAGGGSAAAYKYGQGDELPAGFEVGGYRVSGMSASAAASVVKDRIEAILQTKVQARLPGESADSESKLPAYSLAELGLKINADEALKAMEEYGERSWWERALERLRGESAGDYEPVISWNEDKLGETVSGAWGAAASVKPVNATREINGRDEVVYTADVPGKKVDLQALTEEVKKIAPDSLEASGSVRSISLPVSESAAEVTLASLKEEGIERKIAEFTTSFATSAAGRSHNVTAAANALNGTLLQPDEVFEYGKIVEKADKEYGYKEAPVISGGKLVPGIGGGICQVSSTLYNVVLASGLEVVERRNHSLAVSYLAPGLDAVFADGYLNFRFKNSTGKQLLIRTEVKDKKVTVKFFGTMPENVAYKTETKQVKVVAPTTKYVSNGEVALGQQKRLQKGASGLVVDTFRIKLVDGKEVAREKMPRSNYRAQNELIAVHPDDPRLKGGSTAVPADAKGPVEPA